MSDLLDTMFKKEKSINQMEVVKRDGRRETISLDKITLRITEMKKKLKLNRVEPIRIAIETINGIYNGITTEELDLFAANKCAEAIIDDPEYNLLGAGICVSNLHKTTSEDFLEVTNKLYGNIDKAGRANPLLTDAYVSNVKKNIDKIQKALDYERDYLFDFFSIKTMEKAYLIRLLNEKIKSDDNNDSKKKDKKDKKTKIDIDKEIMNRRLYGRIVERPQHMFMRVALGIHGTDLEKAIETYNLMSTKHFTHASPTLYNCGTPYPQLSSCFLLNIDDSIDGIFNTVADVAKISKRAGGIGIALSNIRSKGSLIRGTNGNSDGIIPLAKLFNQEARYVNQGGRRKGAIALYIEPWHADIYDFCELRKNNGVEELRARDIFMALWIPDLFMKRVVEGGTWSLMCPDECPGLTTSYGDEFEKLYEQYEREGRARRTVKADDLLFHIMEAQIETGMPYMCYKDNVNHKSNQKNVGVIQCSNLCVTGDTNVLTDQGHKVIKTLVNKKVNIWNGEEWSETTVKQTGSDQDIVQVKLSNGETIKCTPYHKFYIQKNYQFVQEMKEAKDLVSGDKLIKWDLPESISFTEATEFKHAYTHGFFCGDNTTEYPILYLYGENKKLLNYIDKETYTENVSSDRYDIVLPKKIAKKFEVPFNATLSDRLRWLEGYCDANGTIDINGTNERIKIESVEKEFLLKIRLMLQTLGVETNIIKDTNIRKELLPNGYELKEYDYKKTYRLLLDSNNLYHLSTLGFSPKRLKFEVRKPQRAASHFVIIKSVTKLQQKEDTYCFTESKRNMGMFNGVLAGNCAEIVEYTDPDEIAVCNLASICLERFIEIDEKTGKKYYNFKKLYEVAKVITINLNRIIDVNYYPVEKAKKSNMKHRPIGVGVQGLADVFCSFGFPYDSDEAQTLNKQIFETIYFGCCEASMELSKEFGPYETYHGSPFSEGKLQWHLWGLTENDLLMDFDWKTLIENIKKYGMRNSLLTALMPTATTSQIMTQNESHEPYTSNVYTRSTLAGEFVVVNKHLAELLIKEGLWTDEIKEELIYDAGSIQKINEIPDYIKDIFKTAFEMRTRPLVDQSVARGPFIDQTQSLNLFSANPNFDMLRKTHIYGWKKGLKTGLYYLRSQPAVDPLDFGLEYDAIIRIKKKRGEEITENKEAEEPKQDKRNNHYVICESCT